MSYTKQAVKGALTVFIISILAAFIGYLVRLVLARNLSIEDFGLFYAVLAFLSIFGVYKTLGFDSALIKFIPEFLHKKEYNSVKSSIIYAAVIQLVTNIVIIAAIYLFSDYLSANFFHSAKAGIVLRLMVISVSIDSFVLVIKFALQGFKEMAYFAGIDFIRMLLILGIALVGFKLNYGILSPLIAYVIAPVILAIAFGIILIKSAFPEFTKSKFIIDRKLIKSISKYGIFIMATTIGMVIFGYTDTIVLTYFSGLTSVALYNVALPTARIFLYFPRAIGSILVPLSAEFWA
ncbi:MAG: oligosaccharide flippase family protein, partial [Nanoarchaeota archaeon]|nr:oligosaccharide flippase family protein [Nanoarchaeota archaeon]